MFYFNTSERDFATEKSFFSVFYSEFMCYELFLPPCAGDFSYPRQVDTEENVRKGSSQTKYEKLDERDFDGKRLSVWYRAEIMSFCQR